MFTLSIPKRLPTVLLFVLASLLFAAATVFCVTGCKSEDVMTPDEKQRYDALQHDVDTLDPQMKAAESEARAAGGEFIEALKSGDAGAQSAALQHFEDARAQWLEVVKRLQAVIAQQDEIVSTAQRRAAEPFVTAGTLAGIPRGWLELAAGIGVPLLFDRSRKHLLDGLKNALKGNLADAIRAPLKAYGLLHSNSDPTDILAGAEKMAREKEDAQLEAAIRALRAGNFQLTPGAPGQSNVTLGTPAPAGA